MGRCLGHNLGMGTKTSYQGTKKAIQRRLTLRADAEKETRKRSDESLTELPNGPRKTFTRSIPKIAECILEQAARTDQ